MKNLSYLIALFLFAAMVWLGFNKQENIQKTDEQTNQTLIDEKDARIDINNDSSTETDEE